MSKVGRVGLGNINLIEGCHYMPREPARGHSEGLGARGAVEYYFVTTDVKFNNHG